MKRIIPDLYKYYFGICYLKRGEERTKEIIQSHASLGKSM
jgi:hypothetical protein